MEWTIGELAEQASAALAPAARRGGRGRDVPNERVIRWYSTIGLLDPPSARRGRVAVYGRRHLLQLVAVKRRQAEGRSIAEIQAELAGATDRTLESIARLPEQRPDHQPEHRPEHRPEQAPGSGHGPASGRRQPVIEAPSPAAPRPRFWTGAPAPSPSHPAPSHPAPDPVMRPAPPAPAATSGVLPPSSTGQAGRITGPDGPNRPGEPSGPDVTARSPARPGGFAPPAPPAPKAVAVPVHGVRLADGVTLLLDGGHDGGHAPSPDELAEIAAASRELLSLLRERGLTPPEGLHS